MLKKLLVILMSAMMLVVYLPTAAVADTYNPDDIVITISRDLENPDQDIIITPDNSRGDGWSFDYSSLTLTINNLTAGSLYFDDYSEEAHTFNLVAKGTSAFEMLTGGSMNISGNGQISCEDLSVDKLCLLEDVNLITSVCTDITSLQMSDNAIYNHKGNSVGVEVIDDIVVEDNAQLKVESLKWKTYSAAIYTSGKLTVKDNAVVNAKSGAATSEGGKSVAIYADKGVTVSDNAIVNAESGSAKNMSIPISADHGNITISGGTVITRSGSVSGKYNKKNTCAESYGLYSWKKNINISGGVIDVKCGKAKFSDAILATSGSVNITGGVINAIGGTTTYKGKKDSYNSGIAAKKAVNISNATVVAKANGKYYSYGVVCEKQGPVVSGTNSLEISGKTAAFKKKPTFKNCTKSVKVGKSASTAIIVKKPDTKTYTKNQYVGIITASK